MRQSASGFGCELLQFSFANTLRSRNINAAQTFDDDLNQNVRRWMFVPGAKQFICFDHRVTVNLILRPTIGGGEGGINSYDAVVWLSAAAASPADSPLRPNNPSHIWPILLRLVYS